jgi:hypothetical protein
MIIIDKLWLIGLIMVLILYMSMENLLDGKNADGSDISKMLLCDVTLNFILDDINLRIEILKVRMLRH